MKELIRIVTVRVTQITKISGNQNLMSEENVKKFIAEKLSADHVEIMQIQDFIREEELQKNTDERLLEEMKKVKILGEQIGYGNMIECAKALWNEILPGDRFKDVTPIYRDTAAVIMGRDEMNE